MCNKNGNRTSASNGWVHTISPTSNRMAGTNVAGAGSTLASDGAGNTLNYVVPGSFAVNYGYDPFNQMESVSGGNAYGYNGYGERTTKQAGHGQYRYQYDEAQRLLSEHRDQGDLWTNYLWFGGERIGVVRSGSIYYLHNDHLGRPERATNATKTTVWQANNGAFGDRVVTTDSIGGLNVGLPGQYFDAESNLYYNVNRYYEPMHSRYWQADPINNIDPLGLYCLSEASIRGVAGAVVGAGVEDYSEAKVAQGHLSQVAQGQ